jgi:antitoxin (DNA-binding transcriptional repressor) of toxin-antitoxin stability system
MKAIKSDKATISTNDLRFKFKRVLQAMKRGESLTLTYRNQPLAKLQPILKEEVEVSPDDPIFKLREWAEPMGNLTNEEIDKLIYDP